MDYDPGRGGFGKILQLEAIRQSQQLRMAGLLLALLLWLLCPVKLLCMQCMPCTQFSPYMAEKCQTCHFALLCCKCPCVYTLCCLGENSVQLLYVRKRMRAHSCGNRRAHLNSQTRTLRIHTVQACLIVIVQLHTMLTSGGAWKGQHPQAELLKIIRAWQQGAKRSTLMTSRTRLALWVEFSSYSCCCSTLLAPLSPLHS